MDLRGGEPVHLREGRDVEGSLPSPEEGRDGGDVGLVADWEAEVRDV